MQRCRSEPGSASPYGSSSWPTSGSKSGGRGHMRVAIVYPRANVDTVPSLIGAAEQLAERGYDVDLYTYLHAGQASPSFASQRIRLHPLGVEGLADRSTAGLRSMVKRT